MSDIQRENSRLLPSKLRAFVLAAFAFIAAMFLTYVSPRRNALDLDIDASARAQEVRRAAPYDLTRLYIWERVMRNVVDSYVDRDRIDWKRMLLASLNRVQQSVAPVLVRSEEGQSTVRVQVDTEVREFSFQSVRNQASLSAKLREILGFIQSHLGREDIQLRDVEYAAINGMLSTLDPHSVLLNPQTFSDMRASTRGEFGGLGILIGIRDGQLTVIRPVPNTPAERAGIRRRDRIVRINSEATVNMPLNEAVNRLRGTPATTVQVWVIREGADGWREPRRFDLTRAVIHSESVESRALEPGIGYVAIRSFQGNTSDDVRAALERLKHDSPNHELRGLVLDLRDDPGGLLEQAVRVSDLFLESGVIVTTDSANADQRREESAESDGTEPNYPLIVLVNGGSASASEIVAGALKNHRRALIVGERTFGKGSVQVLNEFEDGSALKLTIAQYLTPGDVSIQGVGVTPDVAISSITVDREEVDLVPNQNYLRESDLAAHLTNAAARSHDDARLSLQYYLPADTRRRLREALPDDEQENAALDEFLLRFSRRLISSVPTARGSMQAALLARAQELLPTISQEEQAQVAHDIEALGLDWSTAADPGASTFTVEAFAARGSDAEHNVARAGESFELHVRVTNTGAMPAYRVRGVTKSDFGLFDGREVLFGRLMPGETRDWVTTLGMCQTREQQRSCAVPLDVIDRADAIRIEFSEEHNHAPTAAEVRTEIRGALRPQFAYLVYTVDNVRGNGDGTLNAGESATVFLRVKNVGRGATHETQANLRNVSGSGVLVHNGRFRLDNMLPGQERTVAFTFEVLPEFAEPRVRLELDVFDVEIRESMTERIELPLLPAGNEAMVESARRRIAFSDGTRLFERPDATSTVVATIDGGASTQLQGEATLAGFVRVVVEGRPLWAERSRVVAAAGRGRLNYRLSFMPPAIEVTSSQLVTRGDSVELSFVATDDAQIRDAFVFVGSRKVLYRASESGAHELRVTGSVPLRPGINVVRIFARENQESIARRTLVIRRDGPDGRLLETPRVDEELGEASDSELLRD